MTPKKSKLVGVSFHADALMAEFLASLPNQSEFIRQAIAKQVDVLCPLCGGKGTITPGLYSHYAQLIEKLSKRK
jgi:hypothetical protein